MPNLRVSNHAVRRYVERVHPHLEHDLPAARQQLEQLVQQATITRDTPPWLQERQDRSLEYDREPAHRWLILDGCGIVMPVNRAYVVTTVLTNGSVSAETRKRRNDRRRDIQRKRRRKGYGGGRPRTPLADSP